MISMGKTGLCYQLRKIKSSLCLSVSDGARNGCDALARIDWFVPSNISGGNNILLDIA